MSSRVRAGAAGRFEDLIYETQWLFYDRILENYARVAGRGNIVARVYRRDGLIASFLEALNFASEAFEFEEERPNRSLDATQVEILSRLNTLIPTFRNGIRNPERNGFVDFVARRLLGPSLTLQTEQLNLVRNRFEASNRILSEEYLDGQEFRISDAAPDAAPRTLGEEEMFKLFAELWEACRAEQGASDARRDTASTLRRAARRVRRFIGR